MFRVGTEAGCRGSGGVGVGGPPLNLAATPDRASCMSSVVISFTSDTLVTLTTQTETVKHPSLLASTLSIPHHLLQGLLHVDFFRALKGLITPDAEALAVSSRQPKSLLQQFVTGTLLDRAGISCGPFLLMMMTRNIEVLTQTYGRHGQVPVSPRGQPHSIFHNGYDRVCGGVEIGRISNSDPLTITPNSSDMAMKLNRWPARGGADVNRAHIDS